MADNVVPGGSLELRRIVKRYGRDLAVDRISVRVEPGEFVTLLGPSGSGKTTTLNMIAGFTEPTEGDIYMHDQRITGLPAHRRNIGMVFQNYALFPHMTAFENIAFPLRRRGLPRRTVQAEVAAALRLVSLGDYGDRHPLELSGGQQQRVAFARAIVYKPQVLLMDEPLGALDKNLRESLQLEIKRIHREVRITFVYVTHDQEEALVLSDRVAIFNRGRIEQMGTAAELYERPRTLFVAEFIGDSNSFHGQVEFNTGFPVVVAEGTVLRVPALGHLRRGDLGTVVVRPERMRLRRLGESPLPTENTLSGTIRQILYLGSARKLDIELPTGTSITVREPAAISSGLVEGDAVLASWSPQDSVLLPARHW